MALEHIEYGSLASSETMNNNFNYLDNRISGLADVHAGDKSSIYSEIANINNTISEQGSSLASDINDLEDYAEAIRNDFDSQNNAPDYASGIAITLPYTVENDGYVFAGLNGLDNIRYVYVNGKKVHAHCGYGGGKQVYSASVFRVSPNDYVTCDAALGEYYFYPMKGV